MPLVIENICKSNAKPPGTSKIYYGLDFIGPVVNVPLVIEKLYISQMENWREQAKFTTDWK